MKATKTTKTTKTDSKPFDLYQSVTDSIVEAIESGLAAGKWTRPWSTIGGFAGMPINVESRKAYRGVNVLVLMAAASQKGYASGEWATYNQWAAKGAQVRKGEKATQIVFWKFDAVKGKADSRDSDGAGKVEGQDGERTRRRVIARGYYVFNAAQVDGYTATAETIVTGPERVAHCEAYFQSCGVDLHHGGNSAHYSPLFDYVQMPTLAQFPDAVSYYGTLAHEYTHWTGHSSRLARDLSGRFGSMGYAAEELVAELGAAFVCAMLGIESEPREDHAKYIQHWLGILKADKTAIFTASSKAQQAVDFLSTRGADVDDEAAAEESAALELATV